MNVRHATWLLFLLASCATSPSSAPDKLTLSPVRFADLPGWNEDRVSEAVPALARSCPVFTRRAADVPRDILGKAADWSPPCAALAALPPGDNAATRDFFEKWFQPYAASGRNGDEGLFTGYYEAELRGSWHDW